MTTLSWFLVNNKVLYFFTLQTMHFPLGLPSHLSSLTIPNKKQTKKMTGTSHKKVSERKAHVGMRPSKTRQTRWEQHHNTFTPSLHLVLFRKVCTPQNSQHVVCTPQNSTCTLAYSNPLNEQATHYCSLPAFLRT